MHTDPASLGTILGLWAHPDDEAYLSAGLMALARRNHQRVVVVTATAGEQGTDDPVRWPPDRLAARRRRELAASLAELGVIEHYGLDWPDGGLDLVPDEVGSAAIARFVELVRPDTLLTFGPEGMTGHPDHVRVSAWATRAWAATGYRARLFHATVTADFHRTWGAVNDQLGLWSDEGPPCTATDDLAVQLHCSEELLDHKSAALRAHASQTTGLVDLLGEETFRRWWQTESFVEVSPPPALPASAQPGGRAAGRSPGRGRPAVTVP